MSKLLLFPEYVEGGTYRFVFTSRLIVDLELGLKGSHSLCDGDHEWATLNGDILTILPGYAFDGCSPAIRLFGRWYGTPTPHKAVPAAGVHDALRGYLGLPCLAYTRKDTDDVFWDLLKDQGFPLGSIYHAAVAGPIGSLYIWLTASRPNLANCKSHQKP